MSRFDLNPDHVEKYLRARFGDDARVVWMSVLGQPGAGAALKGYGYGVPVRLEYEVAGARRSAVLETVTPGPFGHEHMADRAQILLWDHATFNRLPRHVRSLDVGAFVADGRIISLGDADEFFLLDEYVEGREYVRDLERLRDGGALADLDRARADALCDYLVEIHGTRGPDPGLYVRRIRELVGHGECIMGILDSYPPHHDGITAARLEALERSVVGWRWRLKDRVDRLHQVHGDFHPWNILFREGTDFTVLDRARGEWGDPADDVACLTLNYVFFSLQACGRLQGPFDLLFRRFWDRYLARTGDRQMLDVVAPFFAMRGLVMASPIWYPTLAPRVRTALLDIVEAVLEADTFSLDLVDACCVR